MVVVAVLAHRQDQHPVAGHRLIGLVQIGGAVRLLPQLVEEAVEHVSVGKVVVVNDVAGIILHAAHDLIGHAAILLIHIHQMLLAEIQILQHALQAAEHGAVGLIVAVQHGDGIVQITAVDGLALAGSLAENGAGLVAVAVQITAEVVAAIRGMLRHRVGQLVVGAQDLGKVGNLQPCVHILVLGKGGLHVLGLHNGSGLYAVFGVVRLHDRGIAIGVVGVVGRLVAAAAHQRQRHHQRQEQNQQPGKSAPVHGGSLNKAIVIFFHSFFSFRVAGKRAARLVENSAAHQVTALKTILPYYGPKSNHNFLDQRERMERTTSSRGGSTRRKVPQNGPFARASCGFCTDSAAYRPAGRFRFSDSCSWPAPDFPPPWSSARRCCRCWTGRSRPSWRCADPSARRRPCRRNSPAAAGNSSSRGC